MMILRKVVNIQKTESKRRAGERRICFIVPAMLLFALLTGGCKQALFTSIDLPEEKTGSGMGLQARAVYLSEPDEIKDLFNSFLSERGVLPVLVTIRNNDTVPLRLHSRNGMPIRDEFSGFFLSAGSDKLEPIHPMDVVRIVRDDEKSRAYREADGVDVVKGALLPPLGVWYVWEEYRSRREFKPLIEASLFPAKYGGVFEPLTLNPGEEASGYLYFAVGQENIPYDSVMAEVKETGKVDFSGNKKSVTVATYRLKEDWKGELILSCRPSPVSMGNEESGPFSRIDSLPSSQVFFSSADGFFALIPGRKGRSLVYGRADQNNTAIVSSGLSVITDFSSDGVEISGVSVMDGLAVCAVHFTRRSRVMIVELGDGGPRLLNTVEFDRKTEKVFFLRGKPGARPEAFAVTSDAFCHRIPLDSKGKISYLKLGNDVLDIAVDSRSRLFVFAGDEMRIYKRGEERLFEPVSNMESGRFDIDVVGEFGDRLVMLGRGRKGSGDTLRVFDARLEEEVSRLSLPTRVVLTGLSLPGVTSPGETLVEEAFASESLAGVIDDGLLVLLDEGTLLDIGIDSDGNLFIRNSGWFPGIFTAMTAKGGTMTLFGDDGAILTGTMEGSEPVDLRGGVEVSVDRSAPRPR
jgi:hypothetical protein